MTTFFGHGNGLWLAIMLFVAATACNNAEECKKDAASHAACCSKPETTTATTTTNTSATTGTESVFDLDNTWTNQDNRPMRLQDFSGHITVAAMIFTHCEAACPRIVADMQRIEAALSPQEQSRVRFLLLTMDPQRDDPATLKAFAATHQLNSNWTLLTGTADQTSMIANVLNVRIKPLSSGGFDHSNTIYVLAPNGSIHHHQDGLAVEPTETLQSIRSLLAVQ